MKLKGKVALITGGTSGIGEASVRRFISEGAGVMIAARRTDKGEALVSELGANAAFIQTDVRSEEQIERAVQAAVSRFGRLDCVFNNAGEVQGDGPLDYINPQMFQMLSETLLASVMYGTKHAARVMRAQGGGSIINNASIAASLAGYAFHVYSAMKAGVVHFTRSVAAELAPQQIRINCVSPGAIVTSIFGRALGQSVEAAMEKEGRLRPLLAQASHMNRAGEADDIAGAAVWLASDDSSFVTGQNLIVDGGATLGRRFEDTISRFGEMKHVLDS